MTSRTRLRRATRVGVAPMWSVASSLVAPAGSAPAGSAWLMALWKVLEAVVDVLLVEGCDELWVQLVHVLLLAPGQYRDLGGHCLVRRGDELDLVELFVGQRLHDRGRLGIQVLAFQVGAAKDDHDVAVLQAVYPVPGRLRRGVVANGEGRGVVVAGRWWLMLGGEGRSVGDMRVSFVWNRVDRCVRARGRGRPLQERGGIHQEVQEPRATDDQHQEDGDDDVSVACLDLCTS